MALIPLNLYIKKYPTVVYGVHEGCRYEGGSTQHLFSSLQKAIWWVKNYVSRSNKRDRHFTNPRRSWNKRSIKSAKEGGFAWSNFRKERQWKRIDKTHWERASDIIVIDEYEVI